jgi:hypothetical protein
MRFMIMVRANAQSEAGVMPTDDGLMKAMADYHEQLAKAGVLLDAAGLKPSKNGWRIRYQDGKRTVIDGPYAESKELIAGYTLIQVRSREEALEWTRRFPAPFEGPGACEIEVRQLYEQEDFEPGESAQRLREIGVQ